MLHFKSECMRMRSVEDPLADRRQALARVLMLLLRVRLDRRHVGNRGLAGLDEGAVPILATEVAVPLHLAVVLAIWRRQLYAQPPAVRVTFLDHPDPRTHREVQVALVSGIRT